MYIAMYGPGLWISKSAEQGHVDVKQFFRKRGSPCVQEKNQIKIKIYRGFNPPPSYICIVCACADNAYQMSHSSPAYQ